ncbi:MAG: recombinase family protein [Eubacteriales bacterium]|nr:recombinase family protein [Eubacteriales bacterium]
MNKIAIYLRLSKEDELVREESNSISTQRDMIHSFIRKHNDLSMMEVLEFKDDGYSGKNMERPGMQEMLELVKKRQIDVVIVKDFSRFSRDYLVIGQYTEQIFPFMGIRFIAINENYDSNKTNGGIAEIDAAFKGLLYDFYSEDLSVKVKSAIHAKKESGKFLNMYAPYGYQKTTDGSQSLVIEPEGAAVIRRIFHMYADGNSMYAIACQLNKDSILCPQDYIMQRDQRNYFREDDGNHVWSIYAVSRILHNLVYRGSVVHHKSASLEVGAKHSTPLAKEKWKVNEDIYVTFLESFLQHFITAMEEGYWREMYDLFCKLEER